MVAALLASAVVAFVVRSTRETRTHLAEVGAAAALTEADCPAFGGQDGDVVSGRGSIPHGATHAALCPLKRRNYTTVIAPRDALTQDVDGLADELSGFEEFHENTCTAIGGFSYVIAFRYPDGTARLVTADTGGCGTIDTAGTTRHGARSAYVEFVDRLRAQRARTPPPDKTQPASCSYPGTPLGNSLTVITDVEHLVSARICVRYVFRADLDADRPLTSAELAVLSPDLELSTDDEPVLTCPDRERSPLMDLTLQAVDQWDDRVVIQLDSCLVRTGGGEAGRLSDQGQAIVDRVVTEIRAVEPSDVHR